MAIDRALGTRPFEIDEFVEAIEASKGAPMPEAAEIEIEIENPDSVGIETEDGGILIDFDAQENLPENADFNANLADYLDDDVLDRLSSELEGSYRADRDSRKDWEETYIQGLNQLGLKIEDRTAPWEGACGVTHPILSEAVVRFQSQAIGEIFPAGGPVRTKVVGKLTPEKVKQASRVESYMNYLVTDVMKEYRTETEKMLFSLPLAGSAFRKVYWDPTMCRPCAMFVPSEDLVVSYGASSLETCERMTHVMKQTGNDIRKLQVAGFYRDVELGTPEVDPDNIQKKYDKLTGEEPSYDSDGRFTLLEMHVDLDLENFEDVIDGEETGIALPYVVTIESGRREVLSIRRNWFEDDIKRLRRQHFVHYEYVPGLGFYGFGLIHMIGGLAKSATSLLRQLVDAGTLSNLPGGLKSRGLRIKGDDTPISPGEFRDVDVPGGAIRDNITFLPYKEPSGVLYQLLGNIVEEGRRFASLTDMNISDMNQAAPVGTTLALIERSMKVMSAIVARLHASMRREFEILEDIVKDNGPHEYPYALDGDEMMKSEDFDDRIDVLPVSDPNSATQAQRIMTYQAALQLAGTNPELYDLPALHRQMLGVLGIKDPDSLIPPEDDVPIMDPVTENMNILNGAPVRAYQWQDQEAHISVHMAASQDPQILSILEQSPNAMSIQGAFMSHVTEHLAFQYRKQIEEQLGVPLPPPEEPLPEQIEVELSKLVADASAKLQQAQEAQQAQQEAQEASEDPMVQMRQQELAMEQQEIDRKQQEADARAQAAQTKAELDQAKLTIDAIKSVDKSMADKAKIESDEKIANAKIAADLTSDLIDAEVKQAEIQSKEVIEHSKTAEKITDRLLIGEQEKEREKWADRKDVDVEEIKRED